MDPRKHTNEVAREEERGGKKVKIESISAEEGPFLDGIIKAETAPGETETATVAAAKAAAANVDVLEKAAAIKKAEVMSKIKKIEALIEENPEFREVIEGFMAVVEMTDRIHHKSMNLVNEIMAVVEMKNRILHESMNFMKDLEEDMANHTNSLSALRK
jgi:hypothetical protein